MNQRNQEEADWGQSDQEGRQESHYSVPGNMQEMQMSNQDSYQPPVRDSTQTITHQFNSPQDTNRMQGTIDHLPKDKTATDEVEVEKKQDEKTPDVKLTEKIQQDEGGKSLTISGKRRKQFADKEKYRKKAVAFDGAQFKFHGKIFHFDPVSFYCLDSENTFRRWMVWLITWPIFDQFITIVILLNSVMLGMRDMSHRMTVQPGDAKPCNEWNQNLETAGFFLTAIFMFEATAKIIGMGFVMHKQGYLRDYWNWLDFFVVVVSVLDFFPDLTQYKSLKVLRTLRILRPLRSINKIKQMKVYINALLASLPGLTTVVFFLTFVLSIFGIFGIHQFMGDNYKRCRLTMEPEHNPDWLKQGCLHNTTCGVEKYMPWKIDPEVENLCMDNDSCQRYLNMTNSNHTVFRCGSPLEFNMTLASDNVSRERLIMYNLLGFEDFGKAMLTIFTAITLEGWTELMYNYMDSNSATFSVLFFFLLVFFGAFVAINLVLAQIMESFEETEAKRKDQEVVDEKEKEAADKQELIEKEREAAANKSIEIPTTKAITQKPETIDANDSRVKVQFGGADIPAVKKSIQVQSKDVPKKSLTIPVDRTYSQKKEAYQGSSLPSIDISNTHRSAFAKQIATIEQNIDDNPDQAIIDEQCEPQDRNSNKAERSISPMHNSAIGDGINKVDSVPEEILDGSNLKQIVIEGDMEFSENQSQSCSDSDSDSDYNLKTERASKRRAKTNCILNFVYKMVTAPFFNFLIFCMIIGNTAVLAYDGYPISEFEVEVLGQLNNAFTWIFFSEMLLKIIGLGSRNYFADSFNLFDSIVVMISLIDYAIALLVSEDDIGSLGDALNAFRALRMLRVIKLARSWTALQEILKGTMRSLGQIQYFSVLLFLFMYIAALLGIELFAYRCLFNSDEELIEDIPMEYKKGTEMAPPRENFENIFEALTTVFIIIIGEDWQVVMYNYGRSVSSQASWYFIIVFIMGNFMLLSLFTVVLLNNFAEENQETEKPKTTAEDLLKSENMSSPGKTNSIQTQATVMTTPKQKFHHFFNELKYQYIVAFGTREAIQLASDERSSSIQGISLQATPVREGQVVPAPLDSLDDVIKEDMSEDLESSQSIATERNGQKPDKNIMKVRPVPNTAMDIVDQRLSQHGPIEINTEIKGDGDSPKTSRKLKGETHSLVYDKPIKVGTQQNLSTSLQAREKLVPNSDSKHYRINKKLTPNVQDDIKKELRPQSLRVSELDPAMPRKMNTVNIPEPLSPMRRASVMSGAGMNTLSRQRSIREKNGVMAQQSAPKSLSHLNIQLDKKIKNNEQDSKLKGMQRLKMHGNSLYCFSKQNSLRCICFDLIHRSQFDQVILFFILFSTVLMAVETPLDDPNGHKSYMLKFLDKIMTVIFVLEMLIKIISYGFVINGPTSYIRDGWSQIDFIIVLASISSMAFENYDQLSFLKVFRMVRILKPLRMIARIRGLQLAILSLIKSIPDITNLLLIVMFFIFLLSILMTTLFSGKFYRCQFADPYLLDSQEKLVFIQTKWDCLNYGGDWVKPDLNFDSTGESFLSLFTIQSTEGWIPVMWNSVDARGRDLEPLRNYRRPYILLYIMLILLLCLLFLNLFVGVVIVTFNKESQNLTLNHLLDPDQEKYIKVQMMAYSAKPKITLREDAPMHSALRAFMIRIVNNIHFDNFIMACIGLNTLILCCKWYGMSAEIQAWCDNANLVFMGIFSVECIIKLIAMRKTYFKDNWNNFDFVVVMFSSLALLIKATPSLGIDVNAQATIIRILRVLRVLRLIKRAKKLQIIFETIILALPAMGSLGALLLLFVFLFAIVGMQMFAFVKWQSDINYHANFTSFMRAFLLLIRAATGEGWNALMYDLARGNSITFQCDPNGNYDSYLANNKVVNECGLGIYATIYFFLFQVIVGQVFLNLFIAIVVDTFIGQSKQHNLPLSQLDIDTFVELWSKYDPDGTTYMDRHDFEDFLISLCESETDFFAEDQDEVLDPVQRENLIIHLEIPMHRKLKAFMFYDVLLTLCRYTCQQVLLKTEKEELREMIFVIRQCQGGITEEQLKIEVNRHLQTHTTDKFKQVFENVGADPKIDLIKEINKKAALIAGKTMKEVDFAIELEGTPNFPSVYTSKHVYLGVRVVRIWKENYNKRKTGTIDVPSSRHFGSVEPSDTQSVHVKPGSPSNSSTMNIPPTITSANGNHLSYSPNSPANNKAYKVRKGFQTRKVGSYGDVENNKGALTTMAPIREENARDMIVCQNDSMASSSPIHTLPDNNTFVKDIRDEPIGATQALGYGLGDEPVATGAFFDQPKGQQSTSPIKQAIASQHQSEEDESLEKLEEPDAGADDFINEIDSPEMSPSEQGFNELAERDCDTINRAQQLSEASMIPKQ